jgi:2-oxoglutarate/2-oxoacid ferredoxin oxidoreductase subunit alpha
MGELRLMKGNEVLAEAAVRCGCDGYFGYPITPQSEVMETLMELIPGKLPAWWCCRQKVKWPP